MPEGGEKVYEKFESLLAEKNVTAYQVSKATGIGQSTFTDWKTGRSKPGVEKLHRISKFFNVPIEYFLEDKETA